MTDPNLPLLELRSALLDWWQHNGRHTIPWKLRPAGEQPEGGDLLDPYGTWVAEANRR
jgi:adenine-specific DNA glycosylase